MFLVKCSCGCFFTLKNDALRCGGLICPNCSEGIDLERNSRVSEVLTKSPNPGVCIQVIPDNAKITVTFET